jgi:tight adherence protein B
MDSLMDALVSGDGTRYKEVVIAIAALSNAAYNVLHAQPRGYAPPGGGERGSMTLPRVLKLMGILLIFAGGWYLGILNETKINEFSERYKASVKEWVHEYERQFLTVNIHYLVGVPVLLGVAMGIMTFDPFGFVIFGSFGILAGWKLPGWLLRNIRLKRGLKVEAQLMDALILMSNGLKSGIDLVQCIELVHRDLQPPISEEFGLCLKNYGLGTALEKALEGVEERVQSRLLSYVIKAVVIQRQVGGNLTKIFDRIVENIREESKLSEKTRAMTAQQRLQSLVVGIMPWVMLAVMFLFQPAAMREFYFTGLGVVTLLFCVVWILIGMRIVNRLGDIQV